MSMESMRFSLDRSYTTSRSRVSLADPCRVAAKSSDDDESQAGVGEDADERRRKFRHGLDTVVPALCNSSACF
jgi:hypothetical protein